MSRFVLESSSFAQVAKNNLLRVLRALKVDRNIAIDSKSIFSAILAKVSVLDTPSSRVSFADEGAIVEGAGATTQADSDASAMRWHA